MKIGGNYLNNSVMLLVSIGIAYFPGTFGALYTADSISNWYTTLNKPELNPPNWVFSPVWSLLYLLLGISLFRFWRVLINKSTLKAIDIITLIVFFVQLTLNGLWSLSFFGLQNPQLGLLNISVLVGVTIINIYLFWKYDKIAAMLLIPYLAWISFATYLNAAIYFLN